MKFEITAIERRTEDDRAVGLTLDPAGTSFVPDRFEVGQEVEVEAFEHQPDMARYLAAISEAKAARVAHEELRSGDGAHHEDRALSLLLGEIDP